MTRRVVWSAVLVLALATLGGAWFLATFERVPVKERSEEQTEARRNPYLALERFLVRLDRPLVREGNARILDALPAGGTLILDRQRRQHMVPDRVDRLFAWVDQGGYLIVAPEAPRVADPLLDRLGIGRGKPLSDREADADDEPRPPARPVRLPEKIGVALPGAPRPLTVGLRGPSLHPGDPAPEWRSGVEGQGDRLLHYPLGQGQVTVIAGLDGLIGNRQIGDHDHAELLWTLLQRYQLDPARPVILAARLEVPDLWDWLAGPALTALVSGLTLLGLWLWQRLPRFGPPLPEPEPDRRALREHLAALGRYLWRTGGLDHWLAAAREAFQARLAVRHPAVAALAPAEQAAALARLSRRSQGLIAAALHGPATSPHAFTTALRTLRTLERHL